MSALCPTTTLKMEPPSAQSPFARCWHYLHQGDVNRLLRGHYSPVIALTDSCVDPTRSPLLWPIISLVRGVSAGCDQPLLLAGPSRRYLCESFPECLGPCHGGTWSAPACFFPHVIGLPPYAIEVGLTRVNPSKRFHDGSHFRDCSHFVMFRPSGLLASQIVPTAATYRRRAAEAFTSEQNMRRCLRMHRIC
jgi:hypothetical protein